QCSRWWSATAARNAGNPIPGAYWLWPARIAATAASATSAGGSKSGKPCPRLTASWATASAVISAKIVVPKPCRRDDSWGRRAEEDATMGVRIRRAARSPSAPRALVQHREGRPLGIGQDHEAAEGGGRGRHLDASAVALGAGRRGVGVGGAEVG